MLEIEWKRRITIAGIAAGVFIGYRYLLPAVIPFLAAWVLAVWIYPAAVRLEKKIKIKKSLAGGILLALLFVCIGIVMYWGIKEVLVQARTAVKHIPALTQWCMKALDRCCILLEDAAGIQREVSRTYILEQFSGMGKNLSSMLNPETIGSVFSWVKSVLFLVSGVVVTFICSILIMGDMENIRKKIWDYSWLVGVRRIVRRLQSTTVTYLKAQIVIIVLVGAVCAVGCWMMGSPYFLIFGIVLGIFDALPLIGTGTFLYPAALVLLLRGRPGAALGCVLLDIITSVLREFLEPKLLGTKLGVSPVMVLAAVYLGILLFGIWGVILGPLAFSTAYEIGREWDVWD